MRITVMQDALAKALSTAGRAVPSRSTLPVLGNILMEAKDGTLRLSATNLEIGINCWIPATVEEAGAITLPARLLSEFVNSLPVAQRISLSVKSKTQTAAIKCGGFDANIKGIDASEFPIVPQPDTEELTGEAISLPAEMLARIIDRTQFAAATDESRPTLTGLKVTMADNRLSMAATDGYRLSVQSAAIEYSDERMVIVPAKSLAEVSRVIDKDTKGDVAVVITDRNQISFTVTGKDGRVQVLSSTIDANFPDYKGIIPKHATTTATMKTGDLLKAVRTTQLFARDNANIMRLHVNGNVKASATSVEMGDGVTEIDATIEGPEVEIAFNALYLIQVLSELNEPEVTLSLTEPNRPGTLRTSDPDFLHVVMPMHPPK